MEPSRSTGQYNIQCGVHQPDRHSFHQGLRDFDHTALSSGQEFTQMTTIYSARWVLPVSAAAIERGAVAVEGQRIAGVGSESEIVARFPDAKIEALGDAVILPGLINTHTHLELTAMRGYLEKEENDFFAWLRKLTIARLERMTPDDIRVSATWGACEAVRAGVTYVGDA